MTHLTLSLPSHKAYQDLPIIVFFFFLIFICNDFLSHIFFFTQPLWKVCIESRNIKLLLTEREGRTGNIGPRSWQCGQSAARSVQLTTEGQCSPVRLEQTSRSARSLIYGAWARLVLNLPSFENKRLHSLCMETVRIAKSRPRKNQSECSDPPQDYFAI